MAEVKINNVWSVNDQNWKFQDFSFDHTVVVARGKPTQVSRGVHEGFSLPIYDSDNEELFECGCVPTDWDGVTDPSFLVGCWLDTANNDKDFALQVSINCLESGDTVPTTTNDFKVETNTGNADQYKFFIVEIPFTGAAGLGCVAGNAFGIRIRRVAVVEDGADEITGEVVVKGVGIKYNSNKAGTSS
jgi:hypothetical protein